MIFKHLCCFVLNWISNTIFTSKCVLFLRQLLNIWNLLILVIIYLIITERFVLYWFYFEFSLWLYHILVLTSQCNICQSNMLNELPIIKFTDYKWKVYHPLDDLENLKKKTFAVKEGIQYRIRIDFYVQREIVTGLKYIQKVIRHGIQRK